MPDLVGKGSERLYGEGVDSEGCTQQIDIRNRRFLFSASLRETGQLHRQFTSRSIGLVHSLPSLVLFARLSRSSNFNAPRRNIAQIPARLSGDGRAAASGS
jgi:hypothetical protein